MTKVNLYQIKKILDKINRDKNILNKLRYFIKKTTQKKRAFKINLFIPNYLISTRVNIFLGYTLFRYYHESPSWIINIQISAFQNGRQLYKNTELLLGMHRTPNYSHYSSIDRFKNEYSVLNRMPYQGGAIDKFKRQLDQSLESINSIKRARKLKKISRLHQQDEQQYINLTYQLANLQNRLDDKQKRQKIMQEKFMERFQKSYLPLIQSKNNNSEHNSNPYSSFPPTNFPPYQMMPTYPQYPYPQYYPNPYQNPGKYSRASHTKSLHSMPGKETRKSLKSAHRTTYKKFSAQKSKKLLSKFRIAGYVVFFSLYFPKFSQNLTKLRHDKFLKQQQINLQDQLDKFYKKQIKKQLNLHKITLNNIDLSSNIEIQDSDAPKKKKKSIEVNNLEVKLLFSIQEFTLSLGIVQNILKIYLDKFSSLANSGYFQPYYQLFCLFCVNKTFVHDYIFAQSELQCLTFNKDKGYVILNQKWQKFLLINVFFMQGCLIPTLFDFMKLQQNQKLIFKKSKSASVTPNEYIRSANETMMAYLILLIIVENKYSYLTTISGNFYQLPQNIRPIAKILPESQDISPSSKFFDFPMEGLKGILDIKQIILKNYKWFTKQTEAQFTEVFDTLYTQIKKYQKSQYKSYFQQVLNLKKIKPINPSIYQRQSQSGKQKKQVSKSKKNKQKSRKKIANSQQKENRHVQKSKKQLKQQKKEKKKKKQ